MPHKPITFIKFVPIGKETAIITMADNYLEKKFEELATRGKGRKASGNRNGGRSSTHPHRSLDSLLLKNRSCRGYDTKYIVSQEELETIIAANCRIPSAKNQQMLRYKPVTGKEAETVTRNIKLAGALPELHLPFPGTEPNAYIIVCSIAPEQGKWIWTDLGISAQSMLLKATDMGLNGLCIGAFNQEEIKKLIRRTDCTPLLLVAIGKSIEHIQLLPIDENENHNYFRENGVHYVPKVRNLIID